MKRLIIAAAALAAACSQPGAAPEQETPSLDAPTLPMADAAGNRMEALTEQNGRFCSSDGAWCVAIGESAVTVTHNGQNVELAGFDAETGAPTVWPVIIREGRNDQSVQLGLAWQAREMYSGGGGEATNVTLYRLTPGSADAPDVLTWPLSANKLIRACFNEADQRERRGACHDEYNFQGQLALDTDNANGPPRLVLTTLATTFPGDISLSDDADQRPPLQASDLVTVTDAECSYRRLLTLSDGAYVYDALPPACEDYQLQ